MAKQPAEQRLPPRPRSHRVAIGERYYRDTDRLLEGGIWAEVMIGHN